MLHPCLGQTEDVGCAQSFPALPQSREAAQSWELQRSCALFLHGAEQALLH